MAHDQQISLSSEGNVAMLVQALSIGLPVAVFRHVRYGYGTGHRNRRIPLGCAVLAEGRKVLSLRFRRSG